MKAFLIDPEFGELSAKFAPLPLPSLHRWEYGLQLDTPQADKIAFAEIQLISVAALADGHNAKKQLFLILFIRDHVNPFVVNARSVDYANMLGKAQAASLDAFRQCARFIVTKCKTLVMDRSTAAFLKGGMPPSPAFPLAAVTTALGKSLVARLAPGKKPAAPASAPPVEATPAPASAPPVEATPAPAVASAQTVACPFCRFEQVPAPNCQLCSQPLPTQPEAPTPPTSGPSDNPFDDSFDTPPAGETPADSGFDNSFGGSFPTSPDQDDPFSNPFQAAASDPFAPPPTDAFGAAAPPSDPFAPPPPPVATPATPAQSAFQHADEPWEDPYRQKPGDSGLPQKTGELPVLELAYRPEPEQKESPGTIYQGDGPPSRDHLLDPQYRARKEAERNSDTQGSPYQPPHHIKAYEPNRGGQQRGGCLTAFLIFQFVVFIPLFFSSLIVWLAFTDEIPLEFREIFVETAGITLDSVILILLGFMLFNLIFCLGIWKWKLWGAWGLIVLAGLSIVLSFIGIFGLCSFGHLVGHYHLAAQTRHAADGLAERRVALPQRPTGAVVVRAAFTRVMMPGNLGSGGIYMRYFFVFTCLLGSLACRQQPTTSAIDSITAADLDADIAILASDEYEGRAPASPGEEKTVNFLSQEFAKLGLKPGNGESWFQQVPLVSINANTDVALTFSLGDQTLEIAYGEDMMVWTKRVTETVSLTESDLVFVGYGIVAPEYGWNDYRDLDVRGKTVVVLVNDPGYATGDDDLFTGNAMTYYGRWTYKYEEAARQGAAGALIIHRDGPAGYPWAVVSGSWSGPQFDLESADGNQSRCAVEGWLHAEAAERLFAACGQDLTALESAATKSDFKATPLSARVSTTIQNTLDHTTSRNVVALWPGQERADEYIFYVAHWDHLGKDESLEGDQIYNGAVDNATGTAALLEIAEAFAMDPPKRSVVFLAVTAEEQGLLGSRYYTTHPLFPTAQTVAIINMDGLSTIGPTRDVVVTGYGASELDDYLALAAYTQNRVLVPDPEPEKGYFYRSDHLNFAKKGVPALYASSGYDSVANGEEWGREQAGDYLKNRYHKPADNYDPNWNLEGAAEDLRLYFQVGHKLANEDSWPNWKAGNEFRAIRDKERP